MARPRKEGMDYFPHDTDAANDKKIKALRMLYGNDGYTFYFILLEMIYREPTFELDVSDAETIQILSKECGINDELFNQILQTAMKRDCFDREAYEERKVLTSNGIKKRASVVVDKRVKMQEKHAKRVSDAETGVEMPQSKVKVKESKSKVKEDKEIKEYHENTVELTNHLIDLMRLNNENVKVPATLEKWNDEMDKIERIDKYEYMQIRSVIDWCQQDSFWRGNILSVSKLREKMPTLLMQMQRPKGVSNGKVSSFTKLQQMAREEEQREASGRY